MFISMILQFMWHTFMQMIQHCGESTVSKHVFYGRDFNSHVHAKPHHNAPRDAKVARSRN